MSDPYYSLYCKQRELQRFWQLPWACGFASLITCFRLLGDRTTENTELIRRFKQFGQKSTDGMSSTESVRLAKAFKYRADHLSTSDWPTFERWLDRSMAKHHPVMLSVDSAGDQDEAGHWWVVFGSSDETQLWIMDPQCPDPPFELLPRREIRKYASCNDGEGYLEYDAVAISAPPGMGMTGVCPSASLMEFLNENIKYRTGWTSQEIAAALVDNHFSSLDGMYSRGTARGTSAIPVSELLHADGAVDEVVDEWDVFFSEEQREHIDSLRAVLYDIEAHMNHQVRASEVDHLAREIGLNVILIGTNLMDG